MTITDPPNGTAAAVECQTHQCRLIMPDSIRCVFGMLEQLEDRISKLEEISKWPP